MTKKNAEIIGTKSAFKHISISLLIAYLIPAILTISDGFKAFLWIFKMGYFLNLIIGILIFYICGFVFGKRAGIDILIKKKDYEKIGIKYSFLTLITTSFLSSWIGFFQEGIDDIGTNDDPFVDYLFKPMFWILFFGIIPVIFVGRSFGKKINSKKTKFYDKTLEKTE